MSAAGLTSLPSLPPDTAGKWMAVVREDAAVIDRWFKVAYQMRLPCLHDGPALFAKSMTHRPSPWGAAYYYWTPSCELVLRLTYFVQRKQHQALTAGFTGTIAPQEALDLLIDQTIVYLRERDATSAFAVPPKQAGNPGILTLFDLVMKHPRIVVTREADSPRAQRWNLIFPELQKA